jgi:hypothetical protein
MKMSDSNETKLDDESYKYVFIEYSEKSKTYKSLWPDQKKLMVSSDVELNE